MLEALKSAFPVLRKKNQFHLPKINQEKTKTQDQTPNILYHTAFAESRANRGRTIELEPSSIRDSDNINS